MGIKGLWTVLTPFSEKKSLHEIRGETLAVDLSGWVCDSQNVTDYHVQPKLYLRNLFFRTVYLLLSDINPIFVLEGDAPALKQDVMAARNAIQFRGAAPKSDASKTKRPDVARRRFGGVLKECENLLKSMGVSCIKGRGEAEATCAALNAQGLVDAVVSQDSDSFAYGATRVYRNFSVSNSAGGGAMQGSVDCYDAGKMLQSNGFGRNKMVALALLCGCDYGAGACGTSITTVVTFLHTVPEKDVIPRLLSWVTDTDHFEERTRVASAPGRCDRCGHVGRTHLKNGCPVCATHRGCEDLGHKAKIAEIKRELSLRTRALSCGMPFPEPLVMKEFLNRPPENIDLNRLKKPVPSLIQFVKVMSHKLDWSERYCVEKFLPVLTKWHLQDDVPARTIKPVTIKKKRNPRGVPSFEVVWENIEGQYEELIPDDQFEDDEDRSAPWTSIERQDLMKQYYPKLVDQYEDSKKKPVKQKKTRQNKTDKGLPDKPKRKYNRKPKNQEINDSKPELNTSKANVSVKINKLKRKNKKRGPQKTIDSFLAKRRKSNIESLTDSFRNISLLKDTTLNHKNLLLNKDCEEVNESDLSDIIDSIINTAPTKKTMKVNDKLINLIFDGKYSTSKRIKRKSILGEIQNNCSTPINSPVRKVNRPIRNIDSPIRNIYSPIRNIESPIRNIHSPIRNIDSPIRIIGSPIRNIDSPMRNIDSPIRNIDSPMRKLNSPIVKLNSPIRQFNSFSSKYNKSINTNHEAVNTSYFFDKLSEHQDVFEMSLEHKSAVINLESDDENSLPDVRC